jgi:hypothetical protein
VKWDRNRSTTRAFGARSGVRRAHLGVRRLRLCAVS